jgi:hypothetical protein
MQCEALLSDISSALGVRQIAIECPPSVYRGIFSTDGSSQPALLSPTVMAAMERLVSLVMQLRGSAKDWLNDAAPSPKILLPYVLDEAQDVLDAVRSQKQKHLTPLEQIDHQKIDHQEIESGEIESGEIESGETQNFFAQLAPGLDTLVWQNHLWLNTLTPWLLWSIARCSVDTMKLLEGRIAQVTLPGHPWQSGILRLVPIVAIQTPAFSYCVDLATAQQVPESLPDDRLIQLMGEFCQHPTFVKAFMGQLTQEIQTTTPAIVPFFQGFPVRLLIPGHPWQTGSVQLRLAFEFVSTADSQLPNVSIVPPAVTLAWTNSTWTQMYDQQIHQHYRQTYLHQLKHLHTSPIDSNVFLAQLVTDAYHITDRLTQSWTIASRQLTAQSWQIDRLITRLMWCCLHSAYEVMQLMTGIEATVLQPQNQVHSGLLQFRLILSIQIADTIWQWDIMTGQPCAPTLSAITAVTTSTTTSTTTSETSSKTPSATTADPNSGTFSTQSPPAIRSA